MPNILKKKKKSVIKKNNLGGGGFPIWNTNHLITSCQITIERQEKRKGKKERKQGIKRRLPALF